MIKKSNSHTVSKAPLLLVFPTLTHFCVFFVTPICFLFIYSFYRFVPGGPMQKTFIFDNYLKFISDPYYRKILIDTLTLGLTVSVSTLILGYPVAYMLARNKSKLKGLLYLLVVMPLLTSAVVRTYGWMVLLARNGFVNLVLTKLGIIEIPLRLMYNRLGVIIGLTEVLLPFMILSLESVLRNLDPTLEEAASNLGANRLRTFLLITIPLSVPGIASGSILVFIMAISAFVTPTLMGGPQVRVLATVVYEQALSLVNWPFAAAVAFTLLIIVGIMIFSYNRIMVSGKNWEAS